tara:strand:- start:25 stop:393 length:369 start_codon:yes stop_codon:yes gene_type:complete
LSKERYFLFDIAGVSINVLKSIFSAMTQLTADHRAVVTDVSYQGLNGLLNVLDYYFRSQVHTKVYEGRREPFQTLDQLKRRIKRIWNNVASLDEIRRAITQFRSRVRSVVTNNAGPIKAYFG